VRERESRDESHRAAPVRKLTFKDKHALETLPATMARLETDIARAREILADPELYARDRALFDQTSAKLATLSAELAAAEEQWLELELRREELANG
jgi:ATP-binding cassette subfamily F protein uup